MYKLPLLAQGQAPELRPDWSVRVVLLMESLDYRPGMRFLQHPIHPGIRLSLEKNIRSGPQNDWRLGADLGLFHHQSMINGFFTNIHLEYRQLLGERWVPHAQLALGYLHSFHTGPVYQHRNETWQSVPDRGAPAFFPSVQIGLGYRLRKVPDAPLVTLNYTHAPQIPATIFWHQFWGIGMEFHPFKN